MSALHIFGIPVEFLLFALTLVGVALFHNHTLKVALTGLIAILIYKLFLTDFSLTEHVLGTGSHKGEWPILLNLFGLLTGFTILADFFETSGIPKKLPHILPDDWKGGFVLLLMIACISSFLDNIAAAMIGGAIAHVVYKGRVYLGYVAAIVAASNAGGAGSVVGDTTTTMMWIDGISAIDVSHAYLAAIPAIFIFGIFASIQQQKFSPIIKDIRTYVQIDFGGLAIVAAILVGAILTNVYFEFPALGVWAAIILAMLFRKINWKLLPAAVRSSLFLLSLVLSASMMPVKELPGASWETAFMLGFVSAVFDNIPLTKLALEQGGFDWGVLAYCVGFGGSMIWFGSSAGVAISNLYPEAKSVTGWIKSAWYIIVAYAAGFFILLAIHGWKPLHSEQHPVAETTTIPQTMVLLKESSPSETTRVPSVFS